MASRRRHNVTRTQIRTAHCKIRLASIRSTTASVDLLFFFSPLRWNCMQMVKNNNFWRKEETTEAMNSNGGQNRLKKHPYWTVTGNGGEKSCAFRSGIAHPFIHHSVFSLRWCFFSNIFRYSKLITFIIRRAWKMNKFLAQMDASLAALISASLVLHSSHLAHVAQAVLAL